MTPRIYKTVAEINKNARPDEYLINLRNGLDANGNPKPYDRNRYGSGYYRHNTSPIRQNPMPVLARAVEEFITSKTSRYSSAICIEYVRKGVKVTSRYDNEKNYKMYISKRFLNFEDKIVKTELTPTIRTDINPFDGVGDYIKGFKTTNTARVNACAIPKICPICDVGLDEGDYRLSYPFNCQHGYHEGHQEELDDRDNEVYLPRCAICNAGRRHGDKNFQYYFNLGSPSEQLIQSTLGNGTQSPAAREGLPKKLTTVPKNLQDVVVNDLDSLLRKTFNEAFIREITVGEIYRAEDGSTFNKHTVLYSCPGTQCWGNSKRRVKLVEKAYAKSPLAERVAKQVGSPYNPDFYRSMITEIGEEQGKTPEEIQKDIRDYETKNALTIIQSQQQRIKPPNKRDQGWGKMNR